MIIGCRINDIIGVVWTKIRFWSILYREAEDSDFLGAGSSFWKKEGGDVDENFVDEIFLKRRFANKNPIFHAAHIAHVLPSFFKRKDVRRYRMDQNTPLTYLDQPCIKNL